MPDKLLKPVRGAKAPRCGPHDRHCGPHDPRCGPHDRRCGRHDPRCDPRFARRLRDCLAPGLRILFVGINPGIRSAATGHHFAGYSNRFWPLLADARLVPERLTCEDDHRLPEWGLGLTNLVARPTPGVSDLGPADFAAGWRVLDRKVARYRPGVVALVGVTVYRAIRPLLAPKSRSRAAARPTEAPGPVLGLRPETMHGVPVFVLPNPSGRNANYSYVEMLEAFRALRRYTGAREAAR